MRPRSLRTRLLISFVSVAVGALAIAGTTTILLVRRGAEHAAVSDLQHKAGNLQSNVETVRQRIKASQNLRAGSRLRIRDALNQLRSAVRVSDARLVIVLPSGALATPAQLQRTVAGRNLVADDPQAAELFTPPADLTAADLHASDLLAGSTVTVRRADAVHLAQPLIAIRNGTAVVVLSQDIDNNAVRRATMAFLLAAAIALAACSIVSSWLARRLTRPLAAIDQTARVLASGDLSARVPLDARSGVEITDVATTLNRMAADLEASRGAERSFLQAVSHDLRTPLTSIRGYAEALSDGTLDSADPAERKRAGAVITTEARRLERLVRDLLDLSRLESREFALRPRPCDAASVVRETAAGFGPQAVELGIALVLANENEQPISADVDAERLGQIVANLVENALKYARSRVVVQTRSDDVWIALDVSDDGPGIEPTDQQHVFERLYTARDGAQRALGTGLGLAIVHELAKAMGGSATVATSDASGTVFTVQIRRGGTAHK